jgi:spore germination protein YaaH
MTKVLFTHLETAVWVDADFIYDNATEPVFQQLVRDIGKHDIGFLFFFFQSFERDGTFHYSQARALSFLQQVHRYQARVRVLPVLSGRGPNADFQNLADRQMYQLDLSNPTVRSNIANMSGQMIALGFDGVQFDIEGVKCDFLSCQSDEYVQLLSQVRTSIDKARPGAVHLSLALPARTGNPKCDSSWSEWADYGKVAYYADSVIPLAYDYVPSGQAACGLAYGDWLQRVTTYTLDSLQGKRAVALIGLAAERIQEPIGVAIEGIRRGLVSIPASELKSFRGVAIFTYHHALSPISSADWNAIDN